MSVIGILDAAVDEVAANCKTRELTRLMILYYLNIKGVSS